MSRLDIARPFKKRAYCSSHCLCVASIRPQLFQSFFIEGHNRQVGLRIKINRQDSLAQFRQHPRTVVHQRGLAYAPLVVEKRDADHVFAP